jgi:hypothetical protein
LCRGRNSEFLSHLPLEFFHCIGEFHCNEAGIVGVACCYKEGLERYASPALSVKYRMSYDPWCVYPVTKYRRAPCKRNCSSVKRKAWIRMGRVKEYCMIYRMPGFLAIVLKAPSLPVFLVCAFTTPQC